MGTTGLPTGGHPTESMMTAGVGASEGDFVGARVGTSVGDEVGSFVGDVVG